MKYLIAVAAIALSGCSSAEHRATVEYVDCVHYAVFTKGIEDSDRCLLAKGCDGLYQVRKEIGGWK